MGRINREFGSSITIRNFFEAPTIRQQAEIVGRQARSTGALIPALPAASDYAVSHSQRRLWILDRLGLQPLAYSLPAAYRLDGPLDVPALSRALETLVARHESLRTTFLERDGEPRQRIHDDIGFAAEFIDLSDTPDPEARARALADRHASTPFDLSRGPLLRASIVCLAPRLHVLLVNLHHIISDAASVSVMANETGELYRNYANGGTNPLTPLAIHYKDFAAWQHAQLETPQAGRDRQYWMDQFAGPLEPLALPLDHSRPPVQSFRGGSVRFTIAESSARALRRFSRQHGGTLFMALTALVKALLYRHTGQHDIIIGTPVSNRDLEALEGQIGFYVNTVALRDRVDSTDTFAKLFERVKGTVAAAVEHGAYPFDRLLADLTIPAGTSRSPIFEVMLVLQDAGQRTLALDGIAVSEFHADLESAKYTLSFEFFDSRDGAIAVSVQYDADLLERSTIERLAGHLSRLLDLAAADPAALLTGLDMLLPAERLLLEKQNPAPEIPRGETIVTLFEAIAGRQPGQPAVIYEETELTYEELNRRANRMASALAREHHVAAGDFVGVMVARSQWSVIAFLAVLKCGAVYVPIDPGYPQARIAQMLEDSGCRLVIVDHAGEDRPGRATADVRSLDDADSANPKPAATSDDLAYVIYTSGSTGRPKGVLLQHDGAVNLAYAQRMRFGISSRHRVLQFAPLSFDASVWEFVMALANGACLVVAGAARVADPATLADYLREHRVHVACLPPTYLAQLTDADLQGLEILITAGEPPDADRARTLCRRLRYFNAYGPTEATVCATVHEVDPARAYEGVIPIGDPIPNCEVFVLDPEMNLAPIGVIGEIAIGGRGLARGYLNQPELTAASFVADPRRPGHRLYRSGDLGRRLENGEIEFLGRNDSQVKVRGHRIELGEIERCLAAHPGVRQAAVVKRETGLVAYIAGSADAGAASASLRKHLARVLPEYMIPSLFVPLDTLPVLPNGKVDRTRLPVPDDAPAVRNHVPPRTALEKQVARLWRDVLGRNGIGIHDRFFESGGDSIKAVQIVSRLRAAGMNVGMQQFFTSPTIAGLAARLEHHGASRPPAEPAGDSRVDVDLNDEEFAGLFDE